MSALHWICTATALPPWVVFVALGVGGILGWLTHRRPFLPQAKGETSTASSKASTGSSERDGANAFLSWATGRSADASGGSPTRVLGGARS